MAFPHFLQSSQSVLSFLSLFRYPLERALTVFDRYLQLRQMVYRILLQCHDFDTMSWIYRNTISFRTSSRMFTFDNFFLRLTKFIQENKLFAQRGESTSFWPTTREYLLIRALAVGFATVVLPTPPLLFSDSRYFLTFSSSLPNNKGLSVCLEYLRMRCVTPSSFFEWRLSSS